MNVKNLNKNLLTVVFVSFLVLGFTGPIVVSAAMTPNLGAAASFGVLSSTFTNSNTAPQTIITGDVGYSVAGAPVTPPITVTGTLYPEDATWTLAGINQGTALTNLNNQATASCTAITSPLNAFDVDLAGPLPPGTFPPGCYSVIGAMNITTGTTVTLDLTAAGGVGSTWIFKSTGALTTGASTAGFPSVVLANGASACNIFWIPTGATTIGANFALSVTPTFVGTIIDDAGISLGHFANLLGRALDKATTVTTDANTITVPVCAIPPQPGGFSSYVPIPPPLINITKIPTPLALSTGPGPVTYTYTLTNIGEVEVNDVWVRDDKCESVQFVSGDTNFDSKLDLKEIWIYSCIKTVSETETNIATAHGSSSSGEVYDTASATVVVGSLVPPLIHLVKQPNISLLPAGGGAVTYNYTVTNPGTEPLSDVSITDDKCTGLPGRVVGHPGDLNKNDLLESNEVWSFTCQTNLTQTTINIGTAEGHANGLTAIDFSPATVVVAAAVPKLPKTGFAPGENNIPWYIIIPAGILGFSLFFYFARRKQTN